MQIKRLVGRGRAQSCLMAQRCAHIAILKIRETKGHPDARITGRAP